MSGKVTRRRFLRGLATVAGGTVLAACAPQIVKETVVVEKAVEVEKLATVLVEKAVEKKVVETVVVEKEVAVEKKVVETVIVEKEVVVQAPKEPVELQFWSYGMPMPGDEWPLGKWETQMVEEYMAIRPDVNIQFQAMGWSFAPKEKMSLSAGNPPNILMRSGVNRTVLAYGSGVLLEVELPQEFLDDLIPGWYENSLFMGKNYSVPVYAAVTGTALNLSLVKEAGADDLLPPAPAQGPWSFDQYLELMKKCTFERSDGTPAWGWVLSTQLASPNAYWPELVHAWNYGADTVRYEDGEYRCAFNEPEGVAWLQFLIDLYEKHKVVPNPAGLSQPRADYWNQGSLLMAIGYQIAHARKATTKIDPETLVVTDEENGFDFVFVQHPTMPDVPHGLTWGGPWGGSNIQPFRTRDRDAIEPSIDFCSFFGNLEHAKFLAQYMMPVRKSAVAHVNDPLVMWMSEHWLPYARLYTSLARGEVGPIQVNLEMVLQRAFQGDRPQEIMDGFCAGIADAEWVV